MNPSISIVIPTYRPGIYLLDCIQSILNQDFDESMFSFHIFIILNGEKEPYFGKIDRLICEKGLRDKITLVYTDEQGVSNARNIGLSLSREFAYITFVDDDDLLPQNYLSSLFLALNKNPRGIAQSGIRLISPEGIISSNHYINNAVQRLTEHQRIYRPMAYRKLLNSVCAKLFPLGILQEMQFDTKLSNSEDALFMFQLTPYIDKIFIVPSTYYIIRERIGSATRTKRKPTEYIQKSILFISRLSGSYFSAPLKYSFRLYVSRILASIKHLSMQLYKNKRY